MKTKRWIILLACLCCEFCYAGDSSNGHPIVANARVYLDSSDKDFVEPNNIIFLIDLENKTDKMIKICGVMTRFWSLQDKYRALLQSSKSYWVGDCDTIRIDWTNLSDGKVVEVTELFPFSGYLPPKTPISVFVKSRKQPPGNYDISLKFVNNNKKELVNINPEMEIEKSIDTINSIRIPNVHISEK